MGYGIEQNLFADFKFFIPNGSAVSTGLFHEDFAGSPGTAFNENPRLCLVGIFTPAALTATGFGIEVSHDGTTWVPVHSTDGTVYGITVGPSRYTVIAPSVSFGWGHIRLKGGAPETADRMVIGRFQVV